MFHIKERPRQIRMKIRRSWSTGAFPKAFRLKRNRKQQRHALGHIFVQHQEVHMFEAIKWPEDMAPSHRPIHFTNELEVAVSPETIWSLLVDPKAWPSFYPGVKHVQLLDGDESLRLGARFETNLAGQDVIASVPELEPLTRIAWSGDETGASAFQGWAITPTDNGCHCAVRGDAATELSKLAAKQSSRRGNLLNALMRTRSNEIRLLSLCWALSTHLHPCRGELPP
jgi:uncharacterized protein YndB with AHSA1/START domain